MDLTGTLTIREDGTAVFVSRIPPMVVTARTADDIGGRVTETLAFVRRYLEDIGLTLEQYAALRQAQMEAVAGSV